MELSIYQIDAFASQSFGGNPAAVCPLPYWLDDSVLSNIARENNLSETAFFVKSGDHYELRWFTPGTEVDLCGHATLATAWVISQAPGDKSASLRFSTRSGDLWVTCQDEIFHMDFPVKSPEPFALPDGLAQALGLTAPITAVLKTDDIVIVIEDAAALEALAPDFAALNAFDARGVVVTAPADNFDFVSRWFGPRVAVNEDPVTGSAHTSLAPYWSKRLNKTLMRAQQGGARKGELQCEMSGNDRVIISGKAALYMRGTLYLS